MINDIQIRIGAKVNGKAILHKGGAIESGFEWQVVDLLDSHANYSIFSSGEAREIGDAFAKARDVYVRVIRQRFPEPAIRHEFDCRCGARLVVEAHRSRLADGWDTPAKVECSCGSTFGIQLHLVAGGKTSLQAIPIQM